MGADSDDDEVLAVGFDNFDVLDGLEFAPVSSERPWVVAMDRCRAAAALPQRALARQQQVCFMKVLAELGGHRCHGDEMREAGVIDYAIDTVRGLDLHDPLDRPLLLWSCRAIRKVSCPNRLNRRRVRAAGGLPVLIPVLDCGEEPVVLECCHLFKNVCYGHGVARNEMRELGGVNALMRVLLTERFGNATWRAAVALCGLCWATPLNLELITSTPGVMEAIELRLGDKPPWKTAVGLKALRRHLALRTAGQGGASVSGSARPSSRREAANLAELARAEDDEGQEEDEEEGETDDDDGDDEQGAEEQQPSPADHCPGADKQPALASARMSSCSAENAWR